MLVGASSTAGGGNGNKGGAPLRKNPLYNAETKLTIVGEAAEATLGHPQTPWPTGAQGKTDSYDSGDSDDDPLAFTDDEDIDIDLSE